ncbi:MAG: formylglycine-generating enzyme family protein [Pseudomonadota bacterium]
MVRGATATSAVTSLADRDRQAHFALEQGQNRGCRINTPETPPATTKPLRGGRIGARGLAVVGIAAAVMIGYLGMRAYDDANAPEHVSLSDRAMALPLPELVRIEPGAFAMGNADHPDERPVHEVVFADAFYIGATEVTFEQYDAFAEATGRALPADNGWGRGNLPVTNVSWSDANDYLAWLGEMTGTTCRLPSEAEWEYACRAGTTTPFSFGDEIGDGQANVASAIGRTTEVGNYPANPWSLSDMHGNVLEWAEDCWHGNYDYAPDDGTAWLWGTGGDCNARVLRGGSWHLGQDYARCTNRFAYNSLAQLSYIGFRVVCASAIR